jgi:hypothetical protein
VGYKPREKETASNRFCYNAALDFAFVLVFDRFHPCCKYAPP